MALDKYGWLTKDDFDWPPEKLSNEYIETAIYGLFKLNIMHFIKMKALLAKQFHIQPSEIEKFPAWEYELFIKQLNDLVQEENDKQKSEMKRYHVDDYINSANPKNMNKMVSGMTPKMPNMSSMNMSSMKMPKI